MADWSIRLWITITKPAPISRLSDRCLKFMAQLLDKAQIEGLRSPFCMTGGVLICMPKSNASTWDFATARLGRSLHEMIGRTRGRIVALCCARYHLHKLAKTCIYLQGGPPAVRCTLQSVPYDCMHTAQHDDNIDVKTEVPRNVTSNPIIHERCASKSRSKAFKPWAAPFSSCRCLIVSTWVMLEFATLVLGILWGTIGSVRASDALEFSYK